MNICITPNSIKLFGSYISRKLPEYLSQEKSAEALLTDLFNDALTVFSDNGLSNDRNKELVLQHLSIVPQIVLKYIADNPKMGTPASFEKFKELSQDVVTATEDTSKDTFQTLIDRFGDIIGNTSIQIDEIDPLDRFEAVSFELMKTSNQEAIYNPLLGYSENITDPKKVFEFTVSRNVIKNDNKLNLSFRLTTLGEVINNSKVVNTTGSEDPNLPILLLVDSKNEIASFDEAGNLVTDGKIPVYTIKTDKVSLDYQVKMLTIQEMAYDSSLSQKEAAVKAQQQVDQFLAYISESVAKVKAGDQVYMRIDLDKSNLGFIAQDRNKTTNLTDITNINDGATVLEQGGTNLQFYPVIAVANTNKTFRVYEKPLSSLTDEEFETLHYLISQDELKIKGYTAANANASGVREAFMNFYIDSYNKGQYKDRSFYYYVEESVDEKGKKTKTRMVRLGNNEPILASTLTLAQLKEFANLRFSKPVSAKDLNANATKPKASINDVTNLGEYFYGEDGQVYEMVGPRRSFTNKKDASMDTVIYKVPARIEDGQLITGARTTIGDHVIQVGYTNLVPTAEGKLQGFGSYLGFAPSVVASNIKPKRDIKWRSVSERNLATVASDKQNEAALEWWNKSPLSKVITLNNMQNKAAEFGPNFVANFIGNAINLYQGSSSSDIYHEAFHAFYDGILTPSERKEIYDTLRATPGYFTTVVNGQSKLLSYSDATDLELEEFLAEGFREYALSNGKKSKFSDNKIKAFFQKLLNLLKSVFGNMTYAEAKAFNKTNAMVDVIFSDLFKGNFTSDMFVASNEEAKWRSSEVETTSGDTFTLEEMYDAMTSMKSVFSDFITQGLNFSQNQKDQEQAVSLLFEMADYAESSDEYKQLANDLKLLDEKGSSVRTGQGVFNIAANPRLLSLAVDYVKARFEQRLNDVNNKLESISKIEDKNAQQRSESTALVFQKQLLEKILNPENFGKLSDLNKTARLKGEEQIPKSLIENFLKNYSDLVLKKTEYEDFYDVKATEEENYVPLWDRSGNEQLFDELIDGQTLSILGSIQQYTEQGKGVPQLNGLGFKKIMPTKNAIAKVAKLLRNTPDAMDMSAKLKDAAKTDKEIDQLLRRLGDISQLDFTDNITVAEHRQWTGFWESFNKADVLLREFILEKEIDETDPDNPVVTLISKSGKSSSMSLQVTRKWAANFKFLLTESPYADELGGVPVFNLENLYLDFNRADSLTYAKIQGPGPNNITSKNDPKKSKNAEYTLFAKVEAIAKPFEFLKALGIDMVEDEDVRKILFRGDSELGISPAITEYINNSIKNRMTKAVWDSELERWVVDTNGKFIGNLDQLFRKFNYFDENNKVVEQQDLSGFLTQLRELQYIYSNDYTNFSSFNANGDLVSEKSLNSSLLVTVSEINKAATLEDFLKIKGMEHLDPYTNPQAASSKWLIDMFQLDPSVHAPTKRGKRDYGIKISVEALSGSKLIQKYKGISEKEDDTTGEIYDEPISWETDRGIESMGSDIKTKFISDFHLTLEGKQEIMRSEAKSTSLTVFAPSRKGSETRKGSNLLVDKGEVQSIFSEGYKGKILYNEFKNHIAAEIIRIQKIRKIKEMLLSGEINPSEIAIDVKQLNRGEDWFVFDKIFNPELKSKLESISLDGILGDKGFTIDALSTPLKTEIENALVEYFRNEAALLMGEFSNKIVISDNLYKDYTNQDESIESVNDKLFRTFVINNFIQNLNYGSLFIGDSSVFNVEGEDFHKRIAGLISTGKIFRHDDAWLKFLNSEKFNAKGFAKKHNSEKGITADYSYSGYLNTAIIKEAKSNSVYADHYRKMLGLDSNKYEAEGGAIEEADAQGWVSFDTYRLLNISINEWSDAQENLYQKMLSGEKILKKDLVTTFPARKFQYYGQVNNPQTQELLGTLGLSLNNMAFHKYSLVPLVPQLIEGTHLQTLHEKMMEQGIDYVTMETGSKLSTLSKVKVNKDTKTFEADVDNFYDAKTRTVTEDPDFKFTPNVIHIKFLKSQIFLDEGFKGHISLPTQLRKIATIGIMDGGVPTDFVYTGKKNIKEAWEALSPKQKLEKSAKWRWLQNFNNTLDKMQEVLKNQLLEDIELKETIVDGKVVGYSGDSSKLKQYLQDKLRNKEILPSEIEFIAKPDGTLIDDLSLSMISEKLEELLVALVDKTLRRISVNGEALVQVSGTMYETSLKKATREEGLKYGSNGLKFYYLKDENGNEAVSPDGQKYVQAMEVKVALQGDFKKLFYTTHPDGNSVAVYFKTEEGKNELDYDASLKRLNEAIKDTKWLDQYSDYISIPGVRIPTQGPNALTSATIAEFLPEWAGPIIVLPTEITSQTGSDFDIDKLFNMFKNLINLNGKVEQVVYDPSVTESYDELRAQIIPIDEKIKATSEKLSQAWAVYTDYLENKTQVNADIESSFQAIAVIQDEIDQKYSQKKEVAENKAYPKELQRSVHADLQSEIDALNSSINYLRSDIQNKLTAFFDKEILNKEDRKQAVGQKYEEYMADILAIEAELNQYNEEKASVERKIAGKGVKGLENKLFDLLSERVLMPDNLLLLVTPNTTDSVEPLARAAGKQIKKSYNKLSNKKNSSSASDKIAKTSIFEYRYNLLKHQENSVGKDSLGIAAISSTFYAIFTTFGATLQATSAEDQAKFENALKVLQNESLVNSPAYLRALKTIDNFKNKKLNFITDDGKIGYNLNEKDNAVALGIMKNADGQQVSDIISQLINGYVDVAKDAWIFEAQGTKENSPILLFMVMAGISTSSVINMVNNPLVLEYNELKKENEGVFAKANKVAEGITDPNKEGTALDFLYEKYKGLFSSKNPENKTKTTLFNIDRIANAADPFSPTELESRLGGEPTFRDVEILSHYVQIENMANALTAFTMLSKFDTNKISNITEAQKRIEDIAEFKLTAIEDKIIPDYWFDALLDTPIGKFNNDEFIVNLFSKYFKIKNNRALVLRSLGIKTPKGSDPRKVLTEFKNDFMWFLYQNAAYNRKSYTTSPSKYYEDGSALPGKTYILEQDVNLPQGKGMEVNEETGVVKYHPKAMILDINMAEFLYSSKFFNAAQPKEWVTFRLEYDNLKAASEELSDNEFKEKFYQFDNPNNSFLDYGSVTGRNIILQRAALYHTNNVNALFDLSVGVGNILRNFSAKYPGLNQYAFFRDVNYDFSDSLKKMNIYFPQIKDAQMAAVYKENVEELKNYPEREVAEFFGKLSHIGIMQTGMNRTSKYDFAKILDQNLFNEVIENEIGLPYINDVLQELEKSFAVREGKKDGQIVDQFKEIFVEKIKNNGLRTKVRGTSYLVDELRFSKEKSLKESKIAQNKITIIPVNKTAAAGQELLTAAMFYNNPNITPLEFANSIRTLNWSIKNEKLIAPEGRSQKELDKALLVLGIDNSQELPSLKYKSKNLKEGFLSIGESEIQKARYAIKDEAMANASTKAIGTATKPFNKQYESSSEAYANALEKVYPGKLTKAKSTKEQFVATDKVWIFGSTITERAYLGRNKEEFIAEIEKTFNAYHKPLIDKALAAGVTTFNVGTASGIDTLALNYLKEKGFVPVVKYTELGTYYEVVSASKLNKIEGQNFDPSASEIDTRTSSVYNALLDALYESDKRFTPKWFNSLTSTELINEGKNIVKDRILKAIADLDKSYRSNNTVGFRFRLKNELSQGSGRIVVGNTLFDSVVEEILMGFRSDIGSKSSKSAVKSVDVILEPVENNKRYNKAVSDYIDELNVEPLKVGDEVEVYFKTSDNYQDMEISSIQKLNNGMYRIKLLSGPEKEYTYVVNNQGKGEKIDIDTYRTVSTSPQGMISKEKVQGLFEKVPGALEMKKAKLDSYSVKDELVMPGKLSTPILSPKEELITVYRNELDDQGNVVVTSVKRKAHRITYAEHPNAKFYLVKEQGGFYSYSDNGKIAVENGEYRAEAAFEIFVKKISSLENVNMNAEKALEIIEGTGLDLNKLLIPENQAITYTYFTLPFTKEQKETILANFTEKYFKGKHPSVAKKYIEEALEKASPEKQNEIIELLKECYK